MRATVFTNVLLILACRWAISTQPESHYQETLTIRPILQSQRILVNYVANSSAQSKNDLHLTLIPTLLQQIMRKYDVASFKLTFSIGEYASSLFGPSTHATTDSNVPQDMHAPFGVFLRVSFHMHAQEMDLKRRWEGITAELGALFSASLNQMDETHVVTNLSPLHSDTTGTVTLEANLPREELCTENLTPWLKLLPCRAVTGLASLFDPIVLLSRAEYLSIGLYASSDNEHQSWNMWQQLTSVQRVKTAELASLYLARIFLNEGDDRKYVQACPLAEKSSLRTEFLSGDIGVLDDGFACRGKALDRKDSNAFESVYEVILGDSSGISQKLDLRDNWLTYKKFRPRGAHKDTVGAHRFISGTGQVRGALSVQITNGHSKCPLRLRYHDVIPWYLRLYFSTFRSRTIHNTVHPLANVSIVRYDFEPANLHGRPHQILIEALLPPSSTFVFSIELEKAFLHLSEYPPDASRGFDIPAATATFYPATMPEISGCESLAYELPERVYTEPLLVVLPTPDFSMPYNVITMTCTIISFFIGSMMNTLLRKPPRFKRLFAKTNQSTQRSARWWWIRKRKTD